ncbi:hypothetical protein C6B42_00285 [Aeromonas caviae]|nr:hypothetical protein C6B42_00285 [Aeromonas caviae]
MQGGRFHDQVGNGLRPLLQRGGEGAVMKKAGTGPNAVQISTFLTNYSQMRLELGEQGCFQSMFLQPLSSVACNRKREASCLPHFLALILRGLELKFS